ncbi:MAG: family 20 glycosylhydrolase [Planctomycetota bacterium]|nr:family 20 glycosylhydrolase [Planctomycetota bacterium]
MNLVPWPRSVKLAEGAMALTPAGRIVAGDGKLGALARVLSDEVYLASGVRLAAAQGPARAGDIVLEISDRLGEEGYSLEITDRAAIRGGSYVGVAWGTATLLQALTVAGDKAALPCLSIADQPDAPYRGYMKDVARQEVTIEELHATVELCRLYKVRYLHLHLNDDQAWTFPSKAYPKLGSGNFSAHSGPTPKVYDREALKALVRFADERGVTIIPELEGPMHSDSLRIPYPEVFDANEGPAHMGIVNTASDEVYPALDTLLGEIVEVFASSPYIHIGCDEVDTGRVPGAPSYKKFMAKHAFKEPGECFAYYVRQMVDSAKRHGKTPICWAWAALDQTDPKDLIVMHWTMEPGVAQGCLKRGFRVINAPNHGFAGPHDAIRDHVPVGMPQFNYEFNRYVFGPAGTPAVAATPLVIGGQVNDWESTWDYSLAGARLSVPARTAALWYEKCPAPYEEYARHFKHTDALLERLVQPVTIATTSADTFDQTKVIQLLRARRAFTKPVTVTLTCPLPGTRIRYTLDAGRPAADSPAPVGPIAIDKTTEMRVALFDADGRRLAPEQRVIHQKVDYEMNLTTGKPVTASAVAGEANAQYAVDGFVMLDIWRGWWDGGPGPQWLSIDLQETHRLNKVHVFPYYGEPRTCTYVVEVSLDGKSWTKVADRSKNTAPATPAGHVDTFEPTSARYLRVTVLGDKANPGAHLVEVRAYEAK